MDDPALNPVILWVEKGERPSWEEIADPDPVTCSLWSQLIRLKIIHGLSYREFESEDGKCKKCAINYTQGNDRRNYEDSSRSPLSRSFGRQQNDRQGAIAVLLERLAR